MRRALRAPLSVLVSVVLAFGVSTSIAAGATSEQVVFSKTGGFGTFNGTPTPFGFWIWCESDSGNPYNTACSGSMYFYALGIISGVHGTITEGPAGIYTMDVSSAPGSSISHCKLTNTAPALSGPNNTIDVTCTTPAGSGVATGAIVNVTGP